MFKLVFPLKLKQIKNTDALILHFDRRQTQLKDILTISKRKHLNLVLLTKLKKICHFILSMTFRNRVGFSYLNL